MFIPPVSKPPPVMNMITGRLEVLTPAGVQTAKYKQSSDVLAAEAPTVGLWPLAKIWNSGLSCDCRLGTLDRYWGHEGGNVVAS